jgi:hypothetical protein
MGCNICKNCTIIQETESIGEEFSSEYFDVLTARSDAAGLDRFYDNRSKYVLLQSGNQPDLVAQGLDEIVRSIVLMNYHKSTVNIESVNTIKIHSNWFFVLTVGKLLQFGEQLPLHFIQSTIFKYAPSSRKSFRIRKTFFKFNDVIINDILKPVTKPNVLSVVEHQPSNHRVESLKENSVDAAISPAAELKKNYESTTGHQSDKSKYVSDKSIKNSKIENPKNYIDPIATDEPRMGIDKPTEGQQSVVLKHVCEESIKSDIERPEKLVETTITSNQSKTDQKPSLVLKRDLEQSIEKRRSIEDQKQSVNTAISTIESRERRKLMTEKQSEVLKHILENHKTRVDENKQTISSVGKSIDLKIEQNSTKRKPCTVCSKSSIEEPHEGNVPKTQPISATNISCKDSIKMDMEPVENFQDPVTPTNLLFVSGLSQKVKHNDLRTCFAQFGRVLSVYIFSITNKESSSKRQYYGIVRYKNPETVEVVAKLGTVSLENGNIVFVRIMKEN